MKRVFVVLLAVTYLNVTGFSQTGTEPEKADAKPATKRVFSDSRPYVPQRTKDEARKTARLVRAANTDDPDTIRIDSTLVMIPVTVSDAVSGEYVSNLAKTDFSIFENGVEQEIAYFGVSQQPLTVILLLDTSPSTEYKIEEIQDAALTFVNHLNPQDRVEVIKFNEKIRVLTRATRKRDKIYKAIKKARFDGGTSLYDAVDFSVGRRLAKVKGRKAVVLFTDGVDTTSENAFYDDTVSKAEKSDTTVFTIFYDTYEKTLRRGKSSSVRELGKRKLGKMYLEELATLTGGRMIEPGSQPSSLNAAFRAIADELKRQYNLGYYPIEIGKPGERKKLKVRVYQPNLNIRSRDNYIVKR